MAHITTSQERPASIIAGFRGLLEGWRTELARHRVFERTYGELSALTDRDLADIGVSRSQVVDLAWDAAKRV
jgi:uncharacterized protein YjiS (DUF1127 family)